MATIDFDLANRVLAVHIQRIAYQNVSDARTGTVNKVRVSIATTSTFGLEDDDRNANETYGQSRKADAVGKCRKTICNRLGSRANISTITER